MTSELLHRARAPSRPVILLAVFIASRIAYAIAGVRFSIEPLGSSWQFIDPVLLEEDLFTSIWYSHTQPPLFNLFIGLVLKLSPFADAGTFHAVYLCFGAALTLLLFDLMRRLGASSRVALVVTLLVVCSPDTVLYENYLFYTYPMAVLLVAVMNLLHRFVTDPGPRPYAAYVAALFVLVMTRSLFHPAWYVLAAMLPVLAHTTLEQRRGMLRIAAVPLLLIGAWMLRGAALHGTASLSSWSSMNMARTVTLQIPRAEREQLVADGTLSGLALQPAFQRYELYEPVITPCERLRLGVRVLASPLKSTGYPNFNDECYLPIYAGYGADLLPALLASPTSLLRSDVTAVQMHLQPTSLYNHLAVNRDQIDSLDTLVRRTVLLEVTVPALAPPKDYASLQLLAGSEPEFPMSVTVLLAELAVLAAAIASLRRLRSGDRGATTITMLGIGGTVAWVVVVGNVFEFQENHRFRFMIDPLLFAVLGVMTQHQARRVAARLRRRT